MTPSSKNISNDNKTPLITYFSPVVPQGYQGDVEGRTQRSAISALQNQNRALQAQVRGLRTSRGPSEATRLLANRQIAARNRNTRAIHHFAEVKLITAIYMAICFCLFLCAAPSGGALYYYNSDD